jgi:hypothetical protein
MAHHVRCGARTGDSHLGEDEVGHLNVLGDIQRHVPLQQLYIAGGHCISFKNAARIAWSAKLILGHMTARIEKRDLGIGYRK